MAFPILLRNPKDHAMWCNITDLGIKQQQQQHRHTLHITFTRTLTHSLVHLLTPPTSLTNTQTLTHSFLVHVYTTLTEPFIYNNNNNKNKKTCLFFRFRHSAHLPKIGKSSNTHTNNKSSKKSIDIEYHNFVRGSKIIINDTHQIVVYSSSSK